MMENVILMTLLIMMERLTMMEMMKMMTLPTVMEMLTVMMLQVGETKILELEEELRVVANNLKSLEVPSNLTTVCQLTLYSSGG